MSFLYLIISLIIVIANPRMLLSKQDVSSIIHADLSDCQLVYEYDDHDSFLGDGLMFYMYDCPANLASGFSDSWKDLPLPDDLKAVVYGNDEWASLLEVRNNAQGEEKSIPKIKHGYYYFYDRNDQEEPFLERYSFNFDFAIYDSNHYHLYVCRYDT